MTAIKPLPEFLKFKKDMEAAGETIAIYDDGTPYVHTVTPHFTASLTKVETDSFAETFDADTTCLFPLATSEDATPHLLAIVGR